VRPLLRWYAAAGFPGLLRASLMGIGASVAAGEECEAAGGPGAQGGATGRSPRLQRPRGCPLAPAAAVLSHGRTWPDPIPSEPPVKVAEGGAEGSREGALTMSGVRAMAGRLLGRTAAAVDSLSERRLEVAAAAFEVRQAG
jgi:hypothetical protein